MRRRTALDPSIATPRTGSELQREGRAGRRCDASRGRYGSDVVEEECPHGLDTAWCSLCKAQAAKLSVAKRLADAPPAPAATAIARRPRASHQAATRRAASSAEPRQTTSASGLDAGRALARLRPVLFHAAAWGAWPSIAELGLQTAAQLATDAGHGPLTAVRADHVDLVQASDWSMRLRDQRPLVRSRIESHLDGISLRAWLDILNERVFFFARQKELTTLLSRYQNEGQDLLVFDTTKVLAAVRARMEVATVNSGAPVPWANCPCRGRDTFLPLDRFDGKVADIEEVTVVGGLQAVERFVARVVRYHPDRTTEILVG